MKEQINNPWVFYDRDCAMCRRAVRVTGFLLGRGKVTFAPLQEDWVGNLFGLNREALLEEMKLLTVERSRLGGANAILYLAGRVFWLKPLAVILQLPPFYRWVQGTYRWVARRRYCLEGGCALPARHRA